MCEILPFGGLVSSVQALRRAIAKVPGPTVDLGCRRRVVSERDQVLVGHHFRRVGRERRYRHRKRLGGERCLLRNSPTSCRGCPGTSHASSTWCRPEGSPWALSPKSSGQRHRCSTQDWCKPRACPYLPLRRRERIGQCRCMPTCQDRRSHWPENRVRLDTGCLPSRGAVFLGLLGARFFTIVNDVSFDHATTRPGRRDTSHASSRSSHSPAAPPAWRSAPCCWY